MEGLKVSDANLVVYVHPSKADRVSLAILRELSSLLFKFSEIFDGVVLAYDVNIRDKVAKIISGIHPYFGVRLKAKLLLFSPKPEMLLEGKVVKIVKDFIHVIVLGFSSAVISEEDIRQEFKYKIKHGEEVYASTLHKRHVIKVGTMLRFLVKSFDEEIMYISGSLIPTHTGSIRWLDKYMEEISQMDSTKKQSKSKSGRDLREHSLGNMIENNVDNDHQPKKSKRRKT